MNDKILANVAGIPVTESEVTGMVSELAARGQNYDNPQGRAVILEQLISNKLLLADARKNLYEHSPEFKAQLEKVKEDLLVNFALAKVLETVKVPTDEEAKAYFEEHKDKFVAGDSVNASHILVDSEEKANELLADINAGKISFEDAARKHSSCPSSENGGNLGEFTRGQMVPEFDEAVFDMNEGEVKGPVKTQFGYHLIKLNSKNAAKPYDFADIKDQIKQMLYKERQQNAMRSKINQLKILYPVDKTATTSGFQI